VKFGFHEKCDLVFLIWNILGANNVVFTFQPMKMQLKYGPGIFGAALEQIFFDPNILSNEFQVQLFRWAELPTTVVFAPARGE
jgi:hypothetical protein